MKTFRTTCRLLFVLVLTFLGWAGNGAEPRPNVLFIFGDDWAWGDLGCHGHAQLKTPNLDRLAAEGMDFHQFNVLGPVCSPSRIAALTGHYPSRYGVHVAFGAPGFNQMNNMPDWLDPKAPSLGWFFKRAGYRTGHFGKFHLSSERAAADAPTPAAYGYDAAAVLDGTGPPTDQRKVFDDAISFIQANKEQPFYLNLWIYEPHVIHHPTEESMAANRHLDKQMQVYAAVIADGDKGIGRVLECLRTNGLDQKTIIVFSGDNGPEWLTGSAESAPSFGQRHSYGMFYNMGSTGGLRGRKRSLFEGGVRTPLLVRWPGHVPAGKVDTNTVLAAIDLVPTLCAAAGVPLPKDYQSDGENMLPAWEGRPMKRSKPIFWEWRETNADPDCWPRLAVREGDWKLLLTLDGKRKELYNLVTDRSERVNVAAQQPEIVARLSKLALDWKAQLPVTLPATCFSKERNWR